MTTFARHHSITPRPAIHKPFHPFTPLATMLCTK